MLLRLLRPTLIIFGLLLLIFTLAVAWQYEPLDSAMIVSSNFRDYDHALYLMTPDGVPLRRLTNIAGIETFVSASDNGEWILIQSLTNLRYYSVNVVTGKTYAIWDDHYVSLYDWSPQGDWLLISDRADGLNGPTSTLFRQLPNGRAASIVTSTRSIRSVIWSPDGEWLYFSMSHRMRVSGGRPEAISDSASRIEAYEWSPDGEWLYFRTWGNNGIEPSLGRVRANGEDETILTEPMQLFRPFGWSPDGEWYYYSARHNNETEIYRLNGITGKEEQLTDLEDKDFSIGWSPDGEWLYFTNEHHPTQIMRIYRMRPDGSEQQLIHTLPNIPTGLKYFLSSGDDPTIVFATERQQVYYTYAMMANTNERYFTFDDSYRFVGFTQDGAWTVLLEGADRDHVRNIIRVNVNTGQFQVIVGGQIRYTRIRYGPIVNDHVWMSPDGAWVYYEVFNDDGHPVLYRVRPDGSDRQGIHQAYGNNNGRPILLGWVDYDAKEPSLWWAVVLNLMMGVGSLGVWR